MKTYLGEHDIRLSHGLPSLIGLTGPAGVGKTSVAEYLEYHVDYKIISFAGPLKRMLEQITDPSAIYGFSPEKNRPRDELGGRSGRYAMQTLGTEWGREMMCSDLWVKAWRYNYAKHLAYVAAMSLPHDLVVVDDIRFPEELELIRGFGGLIAEVYDGRRRTNTHRSERDLDVKPDIIWYNEQKTGEQVSNVLSTLKFSEGHGSFWSDKRAAYKKKARSVGVTREWKD